MSPSVVEAKLKPVLPVDDGTVYNGSSNTGTVDVPEGGFDLSDNKLRDELLLRVNINYITDNNDNVGEYTFYSKPTTVPMSELKLPDGYELDNSVEPTSIQPSSDNLDFRVKVRAKRSLVEEDPTTTEVGTSTEEPSTSEIGVGTEEPSTSEIGVGTEEPSTSEVGVGTEEPTTSEVGVGTDTPLTSEVGTSTEEPSTSDVGTSTEEPSTSDSSTNTEEPSTSDVGTNTEEPETTDSSTNTDEPSTSDVGVGTEVETKDAETQVDFITANPPVKNDSYESKPNIQPLKQNLDLKGATDYPSTKQVGTQSTSTQIQYYSTSAVKGLPETGYQGKKLTFIGLGLSLVGSVLAFLGIRFRKAKG